MGPINNTIIFHLALNAKRYKYGRGTIRSPRNQILAASAAGEISSPQRAVIPAACVRGSENQDAASQKASASLLLIATWLAMMRTFLNVHRFSTSFRSPLNFFFVDVIFYSLHL